MKITDWIVRISRSSKINDKSELLRERMNQTKGKQCKNTLQPTKKLIGDVNEA